jgi:hypothetical protein
MHILANFLWSDATTMAIGPLTYYNTGAAARKSSGTLHGKKASSIPCLDFDTSYTFSRMLRESLLA